MQLIPKIYIVQYLTCLLAGVPTSLSPSAVKATTDGVVLDPSAFSNTLGVLPSITATQEFVVPRSMPQTAPRTASELQQEMNHNQTYLTQTDNQSINQSISQSIRKVDDQTIEKNKFDIKDICELSRIMPWEDRDSCMYMHLPLIPLKIQFLTCSPFNTFVVSENIHTTPMKGEDATPPTPENLF